MNIHYHRLSLFIAAAFLSACAAHSTGSIVPQTASNDAAQAVVSSDVLPDTGPPACKGQKTFSQYATDKGTFSSTGGKLCIPTFGGIGGSITYPPANPSTTVSLISSTTNYNGKLPPLYSGTPIFYLQLTINGATTFGQNSPAGGGLTGKPIQPHSTYTVYGQAKIFGIPVNFKPCYAVATKGKYGGVLGGVATLLKGQSVPANTSGIIEVYPGQSASTQC